MLEDQICKKQVFCKLCRTVHRRAADNFRSKLLEDDLVDELNFECPFNKPWVHKDTDRPVDRKQHTKETRMQSRLEMMRGRSRRHSCVTTKEGRCPVYKVKVPVEECEECGRSYDKRNEIKKRADSLGVDNLREPEACEQFVGVTNKKVKGCIGNAVPVTDRLECGYYDKEVEVETCYGCEHYSVK